MNFKHIKAWQWRLYINRTKLPMKLLISFRICQKSSRHIFHKGICNTYTFFKKKSKEVICLLRKSFTKIFSFLYVFCVKELVKEQFDTSWRLETACQQQQIQNQFSYWPKDFATFLSQFQSKSNLNFFVKTLTQ